MSSYVVGFFNQTLKGERSALLAGQSPFSEVEFAAANIVSISSRMLYLSRVLLQKPLHRT